MTKVQELGIYRQGIIEIRIPESAKVLSCHLEYGKLYISVLIDSNKTLSWRKFLALRSWEQTEINENQLEFVGTVRSEKEQLVFHVFEVKDYDQQ